MKDLREVGDRLLLACQRAVIPRRWLLHPSSPPLPEVASRAAWAADVDQVEYRPMPASRASPLASAPGGRGKRHYHRPDL